MDVPAHSQADKGPPCDCFSGSAIDEKRHAAWCPRRLWTERNDARDQLRGAVDLVEQARGCVTAALNCTAHPWHGDDRARKWLMDADRLGGQ